MADNFSAYTVDLDRVRASIPAEVRERVDAYAPKDLPERTRATLAPFIQTGIFAVAPLNTHTLSQTAAALTSLAAWAYVAKGLPLQYQLLLSSKLIDRWQREVLASKELSPGTVRNYRGHLARVSHAMGVEVRLEFEPLTRTVRSSPYKTADLRGFELWSRTLSPLSRRRAMALLCLGAGAGLEAQEVVRVRAGDVLTSGGMWLKVEGDSPRLTPVLTEWRPRVARLLQSLDASEPVFPRTDTQPSPTFVQTWLSAFPRSSRPVPQRLRTTWLVEMLKTEPDDAKTLTYSGMERGETLAGYLPLLGPIDRPRRAALMRMKSPSAVAERSKPRQSDDAAHRATGGHVRPVRGRSAARVEADGTDD